MEALLIERWPELAYTFAVVSWTEVIPRVRGQRKAAELAAIRLHKISRAVNLVAMPTGEFKDIPLAEVLRAANGLVAAGLIEDYALGGALAAIYYVEPFTTYDADLFFIPADKGLSAGVPGIYANLRAQGWQVEHEHLLLKGFPIQFLAAHGLTEEAVREGEPMEYEGVPAKVFRAEHIVAIAASVGRHKDIVRINQMLEQADVDKSRLENILQRYRLSLPKA